MSVDELLDLARDKSVAGRTALVGVVSDLYFDQPDDYGEREIALMTNILRQLIHDVEMTVRRALAERLADRDAAPHELVILLANDQIEVAFPVLTRSPVLKDKDLIEIVRHRSDEHQLAIAMRDSLSQPVAEALVAQGNEGVIKTLLENADASIARATLAYLVEQSQRIDAYQRPLLHRTELDPDLARRMYGWVSDALRQHILKRFEIDPEALDDMLSESVEGGVAEIVEDGGSSRVLADKLQVKGATTPRLLIQTLREGEVALFESMFAAYTGLSAALVKHVLYEPGGRGLAIVCKAVRIEKSDFASLFLLSRQGRPGDHIVDPKELGRALAFFDALKQDGAETVVTDWRAGADYMQAIRDHKDVLSAPS